MTDALFDGDIFDTDIFDTDAPTGGGGRKPKRLRGIPSGFGTPYEPQPRPDDDLALLLLLD